MPLQQASARIVEEQHSRVPVYDPSTGPEYIIGIVYSKDISRLMHFRTVALSMGGQGESGITIREIMREITVVPETKLAIELLQEFQERRRHIAIVVDEFGSTVGLVTAEDVLEQVVGELEDEFDISKSPLLSTTGAMSLDGSTTLRDLGNQLHWKFPREAGVETLAGFLLAHLGHIPVAGESMDYEGRRFLVAEMTGHRISRVIVEDIAAPPEVPVNKSNNTEATQ
jgi:putative hemolysin